MAKTFSANELTKNEYPMSVIRTPSMYLGERGAQQTVATREIIDNSVHERIRGFASRIKIIFNEDDSVEVIDNGRGLPVDINKKTGENGIIMTVGSLSSGSNFTTNVEKGKAGAGVHGVGSAATNAVSARFDVVVYKDKKKYQLSFKDGLPGHFSGKTPDSKFTPGDKIKVLKDTRSAKEKKLYPTGTYIKFWFNPDRFPKDEKVDIEDLVDRLKYIAYIVPNLEIEIIDKTRKHEDGSFFEWKYYSEDGLEELVEDIATTDVLPDSQNPSTEYGEKGIHFFQTEGNYSEVVINEDGKAEEMDRVVTIDVALRYGVGHEKNLVSFVNTVQTHMGGVHEQALNNALVRGFGPRLGSMRGLLKAKDEAPIAEDYYEGMDVVLSINVPNPQFVGQQKDKLSGPEVRRAVLQALEKEFKEFAEASSNQKFVRPMFKKVVESSKARQATLNARLAKRRANAASSSAMPAKLSDCDIVGEEESELLICEGDSAKGTIVKARDATYQAVLPIRGKILNTYSNNMSAIVRNKELMDIAKALGAGFGKDFDIEKIRYGKVLITTDADVDGLDISNLLFTAFYQVFRPMVEEGRVYQTVPPLYEVTTGTGGKAKTEYIKDDSELAKLVNKLDKAGTKYKIERNKGLGSQSPESFSDTVLNPETRTLRRITVEDVKQAEEVLDLIMGKSADKRKEFMEDNYQIAIETGLVEG